MYNTDTHTQAKHTPTLKHAQTLNHQNYRGCGQVAAQQNCASIVKLRIPEPNTNWTCDLQSGVLTYRTKAIRGSYLQNKGFLLTELTAHEYLQNRGVLLTEQGALTYRTSVCTEGVLFKKKPQRLNNRI